MITSKLLKIALRLLLVRLLIFYSLSIRHTHTVLTVIWLWICSPKLALRKFKRLKIALKYVYSNFVNLADLAIPKLRIRHKRKKKHSTLHTCAGQLDSQNENNRSLKTRHLFSFRYVKLLFFLNQQRPEWLIARNSHHPVYHCSSSSTSTSSSSVPATSISFAVLRQIFAEISTGTISITFTQPHTHTYCTLRSPTTTATVTINTWAISIWPTSLKLVKPSPRIKRSSLLHPWALCASPRLDDTASVLSSETRHCIVRCAGN